MRREEIPQSGLAQLVAETLVRARTRNRFGQRERGHRVADARHGGELLLVQRVLARIRRGRGNRPATHGRGAYANPRRERGIERVVAHAHEAGDELGRLIGQAVLGEQHGLGLDGDDFAVDEHAVAIEDDGADQRAIELQRDGRELQHRREQNRRVPDRLVIWDALDRRRRRRRPNRRARPPRSSQKSTAAIECDSGTITVTIIQPMPR